MKIRAWLISACMVVGMFTSAGIARQPKQTEKQGKTISSTGKQTAKQGKTTSTEAKPKLPVIDETKLADPKAARDAADLLEASFQGKQPPEGMRMLISILRGSRMGAGDGWFGPAQTRFTWQWLAKLHGVDPDKGSISKQVFRGNDVQFALLDRDKDGRITADDLDWSENSQYAQKTAFARNWFRKIDTEGNGELTKEDMAKFFDSIAKGKSAVTFDEFRDALLQGGSRGFTRRGGSGGGSRTSGGSRQSDSMRAVLVRGLFAGEIGSLNEGPQVEQPAPNFSLKTIDGKETVELSKVIGKKPVVLVFGNYTCRPFCNSYVGVEPVYKRFMQDATFLMVYVREAHPADGWGMGKSIMQPKTYEQRLDVARTFYKEVKPSIPVLVDEINDPAGHAYSGMPSRLYVIDTKGKVAFKNGRGPFGFRVGEMEQALIMALLESMPAKNAAAVNTAK